ncbi:hypothetical protein N658DRAFT_484688 [Parathielavia hyrcaniae]|uniref:Uncharacterized protein n=1 Tax=Parathielavia hyrcaniae TaxID=113614 RepID=A0AAN6Q790_9PEZI|nr:hypothetical protein N658DRAFT_484688 [Parathielavia hyrcaniae]
MEDAQSLGSGNRLVFAGWRIREDEARRPSTADGVVLPRATEATDRNGCRFNRRRNKILASDWKPRVFALENGDTAFENSQRSFQKTVSGSWIRVDVENREEVAAEEPTERASSSSICGSLPVAVGLRILDLRARLIPRPQLLDLAWNRDQHRARLLTRLPQLVLLRGLPLAGVTRPVGFELPGSWEYNTDRARACSSGNTASVNLIEPADLFCGPPVREGFLDCQGKCRLRLEVALRSPSARGLPLFED